MVLINLNDLINNLLISSPLYQFGDDDDKNLLNYSIFYNIPGFVFVE